MISLIDMLIRHEGLRLKPYVCPAGKLTIGVGRNIEDVGISEEEARVLLANDIEACRADLARFVWWSRMTVWQQYALIDMRFNLGPSRFRQFRKMLASLDAGDYVGAATQMRQSQWAKQVGQRVEELARMVEGAATKGEQGDGD